MLKKTFLFFSLFLSSATFTSKSPQEPCFIGQIESYKELKTSLQENKDNLPLPDFLPEIIQIVDSLEDLELSFSILFPSEDLQLYNTLKNNTDIQENEKNITFTIQKPLVNKIITIFKDFIEHHNNDDDKLKTLYDFFQQNNNIAKKISFIFPLKNFFQSIPLLVDYTQYAGFSTTLFPLLMYKYIFNKNFSPSMLDIGEEDFIQGCKNNPISFPEVLAQQQQNLPFYSYVFGNSVLYNNALSIIQNLGAEEQQTKTIILNLSSEFHSIEKKALELFPNMHLHDLCGQYIQNSLYTFSINDDMSQIKLLKPLKIEDSCFDEIDDLLCLCQNSNEENNKKLKKFFKFYKKLKDLNIKISLLFLKNTSTHPIFNSFLGCFSSSLVLMDTIELAIFEEIPSAENLDFVFFLERCKIYNEENNKIIEEFDSSHVLEVLDVVNSHNSEGLLANNSNPNHQQHENQENNNHESNFSEENIDEEDFSEED